MSWLSDAFNKITKPVTNLVGEIASSDIGQMAIQAGASYLSNGALDINLAPPPTSPTLAPVSYSTPTVATNPNLGAPPSSTVTIGALPFWKKKNFPLYAGLGLAGAFTIFMIARK